MRDVMLLDLPAGRRAVTYRPGGDVTVVFESGSGRDGSDWDAVDADIAAFAGTFRYDRAGRGGSDPVDGTRDARAMLDELRLLLEAAKVRGPSVLVGHSFGGLVMRMLAHELGQNVVGLVLVDSMHPDQYAALGAKLPPPDADEPPLVTDLRETCTERHRHPWANPERIDLPRSLRQAAEVTSLGDLPLHVMTSGHLTRLPGVPDELRARLFAELDRLHEDLAGLSSRGVHTRWRDCGHLIPLENPAAVGAAIRDVVARAAKA